MENIYLIHDKKAGVWHQPFTLPNDIIAARSFLQAVRTPGTQVNHFPEDFILFKKGEFDGQTGKIMVLEEPKAIMTGEAAVAANAAAETVRAKLNAQTPSKE